MSPFHAFVAFLEFQELRRSPHGLKLLSNSSSQKIAAGKIAAVGRGFHFWCRNCGQAAFAA
jgi:hypothetical protein